MAKISALGELAEAPASTDEFVIVDKSDTSMGASGTTKRIQSQYVTIADASETVKGKVELATDAETITGTDTVRAVTPSNITAKMDTDGTLTANSDTKIASQKAVKTYGDRALNTLLTRIPLYAPQGFLINGKISVTVVSNNITVAIKTLAGTDPSSTDPVYCRIGDTVRSITAALSVTKNAGTNWCNAGSSELATIEIDYFAYLGYNATDGVVIGFSRIVANQYSDFSATTTNEKYAAISTITTAASTDYYEVVGRFAATLSAGAGYTWSVPAFTAKNLIQRPIYDTRKLTFAPTVSTSGMTFGTLTQAEYCYQLSTNRCKVFIGVTGTTGGTPNNELRFTVPFIPDDTTDQYTGSGYVHDSSNVTAFVGFTSNYIYGRKYDSSNYGAGAGRGITMVYEYFI